MKPRYPYTTYVIDGLRLLAIATVLLGFAAGVLLMTQTRDFIMPVVLAVSGIVSGLMLAAIASGLDILIGIEEHLRILARRNRKE